MLKNFLGGGKPLNKEEIIEFKQHIMNSGMADSSINGILAGINSFLHYRNRDDCRVKYLRIQRIAFSPEERVLTRAEYFRLLKAARRNRRLKLIMESICSTGIRVSELKYFTYEMVSQGEICIRLKGKTRVVLLPEKLKRELLKYCRKENLSSGVIFRNRSGTALNRSMIWAMMKKLSAEAGVAASKVFPHNLRKLFARCYYEADKDLAKLADILGHSNINTTRIYLRTTGNQHKKLVENLNLLL